MSRTTAFVESASSVEFGQRRSEAQSHANIGAGGGDEDEPGCTCESPTLGVVRCLNCYLRVRTLDRQPAICDACGEDFDVETKASTENAQCHRTLGCARERDHGGACDPRRAAAQPEPCCYEAPAGIHSENCPTRAEDASTPCRKCTECEGNHHWLETLAYVCKHCELLAEGCEDCDGTGGFDGDVDSEIPCEACDGDGVIVPNQRRAAATVSAKEVTGVASKKPTGGEHDCG